MKAVYSDVENVIVTALEGGSNYWYLLKEDSVSLIKNATPNMEGEPLAIRMAKAVWEIGIAIPVYDIEVDMICVDDKLGEITRESMQKAINAYQENRRHWDMDLIDASEADWIFQYAVMGEVVFG